MQALALANANASVIAVTGTATALTSLLDTAAAATNSISGANSAILIIEDGDIRVLWDGNTPTASKGVLLKRGGVYNLTGVQLNQVKMIRTGSSNVSVGVAVGLTDVEEAQLIGLSVPATDANGNASVYLASVLAGILSGVENDTILNGPFRRSDSFQATVTAADMTSATTIKAGTTNKNTYVTDLIISTDTAMNIQIQDNTGTPVVLMEQMYFPANSILPLKLTTPIQVATAKDLKAIASVAGNVSITALGYVY